MLNVSANVLDKLREYFHNQQKIEKEVKIDVVLLNSREGLIVAIDCNNPRARPYEFLTGYGTYLWHILTNVKEMKKFLMEAIEESKKTVGIGNKYEKMVEIIRNKISTLDILRD